MAITEQEPRRLSWDGQPPILQPGLLLRRRLLKRLLTANAPVLIVTGPVGSGKTTLFTQYANHDHRATAWLTLRERDNESTVLRDRLTNVLLDASPMLADAVPTFLEGAISARSRAGRLSAESHIPFSLVIDDLDVLHSPSARDVVSSLSALMPRHCRLVLGSRSTPSIGIGGLRALGRVDEIGAGELAFTAIEAAALMHAAGVDLRDGELETLMNSTEGWATGLYLAAVSSYPSERGTVGFSGADPLITDYIWDEALRSLPESTIDFLVRSSVLDRLSGAACDAILRTKGSGLLLRELHRSNLFLIPLDRHETSYRFHRLFAQALRAELDRRDPRLGPELHLRASRWYQSQGNADAAVAHAKSAGDSQRASSLIWAEISPISTPPGEALEGWLSGFTEKEIATKPLLALSRAWLCARRKDGDGTERWVSAAEQRYHRGRLPGGPATLAAAADLLRAMLGREGMVSMAHDASQACDLDTAHGPWKGVARYYQGMGLYLQGELEAGRRALEECERRCHWSVPDIHAECLAQLALISLEEGDGPRWRELARRVPVALEELQRRRESGPPIAHAVSALNMAQEGDREQATSWLGQAETSLARYREFSPWLVAECRIVMARANLAISEGEHARRLLSEAGLITGKVSGAFVLIRWLEQLRATVAQLPVAWENGGATLTAAELRVLHLLPTHLSFPEIGNRLYVSRNTVKTQAISVYRKLGVASRADAVGRAEALGLLESVS